MTVGQVSPSRSCHTFPGPVRKLPVWRKLRLDRWRTVAPRLVGGGFGTGPRFLTPGRSSRGTHRPADLAGPVAGTPGVRFGPEVHHVLRHDPARVAAGRHAEDAGRVRAEVTDALAAESFQAGEVQALG